ncbi:MAG TPA: terminase small subunit [Nitrososphaeraceae archaeon]
MKPLTPKQEKFAQNVACGMTQADAYRDAFGQGKNTDKTLIEMASKLMASPNVNTRVKELTAPAIKKAEVTAEKVINELARIAFFDVGLLYNEDGTIKEIAQLDSEVTRAIHSTKQRIEKQGQDKEDWAEIKEIRTHDKLKALELLGKTLAMFTDKTEHSGTLSLKDFVEQRRA